MCMKEAKKERKRISNESAYYKISTGYNMCACAYERDK